MLRNSKRDFLLASSIQPTHEHQLHSLTIRTSKMDLRIVYRLFADEKWLNGRLPPLIAFVEFFFTFFLHVLHVSWLTFYYMSVPFCCVRCECINSAKSNQERDEEGRKCKFCIFFLPLSLKTECFDLSARCCQCKWFFGLIFSSECETVMHYIIIIIIILPIYNSIFMLRKKQRNSTMESRRKREKNSLKYETHFMFPALDRYLRFSIRNSSFPFRRTFKWHWLLVRIVTHSAFGERIYRAGTHSFCPARIQFEMEFSVVPLFAHGFSEFAKSNGDTKSMLICHRFFLLFFSFRRLAITSTQFVNCPFTLTLDRWSEQKHRNIRTTVTIFSIYIYTLWCAKICYVVFFLLPGTLKAAINLVPMKNHKFPLK